MRRLATFALSLILWCATGQAGDNLEVVTGGGTVISHRLWDTSQFPLRWQLHQDGIINNNATGNGTPAVSNANAVTALSQAFQTWEGVPLSDIAVMYDGETVTADSGCDLVNNITWSDSSFDWTMMNTTIAIGATFTYVGPDVVLDAVNRLNIGCSDGAGSVNVSLPVADYANGATLRSGTILDMDMTWNPDAFDYVTAPNSTANVFDIQAVATHEFGHLFGFSHVSLPAAGTDQATMFPSLNSISIAAQNNVRTLELDDDASSGQYPDSGFWPTGSGPYVTGAITGTVAQPNGVGAGGVRVWAYDTSDLSQPVYEGFTATQFDWSAGRGDYMIAGMEPGVYYVCIVAWNNGASGGIADDPARYNTSTFNGSGHTGFSSECFDDAPVGAAAPTFGQSDLIRKVTVVAGETNSNIDFMTGVQTSDFVLVMDRSGSMFGASGTPGVNKLQALQNAADELIDYLDLSGGHRLGLVQFEENVVPLMPAFNMQTLNGGSVGTAHMAIGNMSAGGFTNIIDGVNAGVSQLTTVGTPNPRQVMLVFSDGKHNRPLGSDLFDINAPIVANDIRFYSVGFGTDVSGTILSQVAANSGGIHVDEQDLDPMDLGKHFLSIAASAADDTMLIDPRYSLFPGDVASLAVPVLEDDHSIKVVLQWQTARKDLLEVNLTAPNGCRIPVAKAPGIDVRYGNQYQIIHVPLPYKCNKSNVHAGTWTVAAQLRDEGNFPETVDIFVLGRSLTQLFSEAVMWKEEVPLLRTQLLRRGQNLIGADVIAEILLPLPSTGDSEYQDAKEGGDRPGESVPPEKRTVRIELFDDGQHYDGGKGDGVYGAKLPLGVKGTYQVRTIAHFKQDDLPAQREHLSAYHFDGKTIITNQKQPSDRPLDRP